ncbi:MAG: zinc ribbon domain-containing protein [Steroidobacteraceae bacterium]
MSEIYANAVDSLRIGIEFFLKEASYSSRKHAILTLFHAMELFLKEYLHRTNPVLIYKNIDAKINDDSSTAGIKEILVRLENLGLGLPKEFQSVIEKIQRRRNRIEHHRYDHQKEDEAIIGESLQFILFFVDEVLQNKLEADIPPDTLREIQRIVFNHREINSLAERRLDTWMGMTWPDWSEQQSDTPDQFDGTVDCPICRQSYLVIGHHPMPFCFFCNTSVDAGRCENCGTTHLASEGCSWCGRGPRKLERRFKPFGLGS